MWGIEIKTKDLNKVSKMADIIKKDLANNDTFIIVYAIGTFKTRIRSVKDKFEYRNIIYDMETYKDALIQAAIPSNMKDIRLIKYASIVDRLINECTKAEDENE